MQAVEHEENKRPGEDSEGEVEGDEGTKALVDSSGRDYFKYILHVVELGLAVYLLVGLGQHGDQNSHQ